MPVQTTHNERISAAREGMIANEEPSVLISRTVEDVAGIGYGKVVTQGDLDNGCTADLDETGNVMDAYTFLGITVRERSVRPETPDVFAQYESARIMRKGVIWVSTAAAVNAGDDVYVTLSTGAFGTTSGGGNVLIPGGRWETSKGAVAGLAKLRLG